MSTIVMNPAQDAIPPRIAQLYRLLKAGQALMPVPKPISAERLAALESDFSLFVREAWKVLCPGRPLCWSWHYDLLAEYLTQVKERKLKRLILNVPPRTAKSTIATICFPCWVWITEPSHAFLCASYSNSLSTDHSVARRNLIISPWFQSLWSERFQLASDRNLATQFMNNRMGTMISTSTGSGAEGRGGDTAILDDPMSSQQSLSDVERTAANRWVTDTLKQRLNDPATAAIIVIMQRLHELDTTGFVKSQDGEAWTEVVIPLEAEKDESWTFPISGRVVERKKGDILQPSRFTPATVTEKQRSRLVWAGQYQQRPAPLEGNLIKRSDVKYYGGVDPLTGKADEALPSYFDLKVISVDCAFKDTSTSDFVAVIVVGVRGRKRFILNVINQHLDATATERAIRSERSAYGPINAVLVEDKANGPAVVQRLKSNIPGVVAVNPQGGKVGRMFAASAEWEAGDWHLDRNASWCEPFIEQITIFPRAKNDDMADAMTQAATYLLGWGGTGIFQGVWNEAELAYDGPLPVGRGAGEETIVVSGGMGEPRVFLACFDDGRVIYVDKEYFCESYRGDGQLIDDLKQFKASESGGGRRCEQALVIIPSGCESFSAQLGLNGIWRTECESDKGTEDGLRTLASLMAMRRLKFSRERCPRLIARIPGYSYEAKTVPDALVDGLKMFVTRRIAPWRLSERKS